LPAGRAAGCRGSMRSSRRWGLSSWVLLACFAVAVVRGSESRIFGVGFPSVVCEDGRGRTVVCWCLGFVWNHWGWFWVFMGYGSWGGTKGLDEN
jgi:hypothetical protein